jgi:hypothetical protein
VQPDQPTFPAQWFDGLYVISPVSMTLLVTVARRLSSQDLAPAQGCQDHTILPHATIPLVARRHRIHRILPHDRDDAFAPLVEAGRAKRTTSFRKSEEEYFSQEGWTNPIFFGFTQI